MLSRMGDAQRDERMPRPGAPLDHVRGQRKVPRAVREPHMLEMAGSVFAARGYHEASMDEIAELAGVSKPMLYSYFGSKEGLYLAYVELSFQRLITAIDEAVAGAGPDVERQVRAGTLAYYRYVDEHRDGFRVLYREAGAQGRMTPRQHRHLSRRTAAGLEQILLAAEGPPIERDDLEMLTEMWIGAARLLADWWLDHPELSTEAIAERFLGFGLGGIRSAARALAIPRLTGDY